MGSSNARKDSSVIPAGTVVRADLVDHPGWSNTAYLPGEVIDDRYRLERELGRGGMGVVWLARSLVLGVDVALKLIPAAATEPESSSRMAREANAAARVTHPALVRVFDFGWTRHGDPFLVMELIRGEPLSETLARRGRMSAIAAVQLLLPIADGLRLAHERSIVHRDIKPGNIIVAGEGTGRPQPKLLDFGIAKVDHGGDGKLTLEGVVLGSPQYMSPEQALGLNDIDARTDVWSLGIALYELLTGDVPFTRTNYNALMQSIIHDEPAPVAGRSDADDALWRIVSRALCKQRDRRWQSMDAFGAALALWLYDHGVKEDLAGNSIRAVWLSGGLAPPLPTATPSSLPPDVRAAAAVTTRRARDKTPGFRAARPSPRAMVALLVLLTIALAFAAHLTQQIGEASTTATGDGPSDRSLEPLDTPPSTPPETTLAPDVPVFDVADLEPARATDSLDETRPSTPRNVSPSPSRPPRSKGSTKPKATRDFGF